MENQILYSPKQVFEQRANEVKTAKETGAPIFTPDRYGAVIAVDSDMERTLTHSDLVHKSDFEIEEKPDVALPEGYSLETFHATYNSIIRKMPEANKDEIFMFLSTADPGRLADEEMQTALMTRLADIQKQDMVHAIVEHQDPTEVATANASEISEITSFFGAMKNAVKVEGGNYFAEGQAPGEVQ